MRQQLTPFLLASAVAACAAAAAESAFEFRPSTGPLRYDFTSVEANVVEGPMGTQEGTSESAITVVLEVGQQTADGLEVSAVFESLEVDATEEGHFEGGDLLGQRFSGVLARDGMIVISDGPETPSPLNTVFDPTEFLAELLPPLPPEGDPGTQSWPVRRESVSETEFTMTGVSQGTAQVVGDTTRNGLTGQVIIVEGEAEILARESPPDAPGEIEISGSGPFTSRYVWDAERRVMLASVTEVALTGDLSITGMGVVRQFRLTAKQTAELQR
jgi:hypothetical protein